MSVIGQTPPGGTVNGPRCRNTEGRQPGRSQRVQASLSLERRYISLRCIFNYLLYLFLRLEASVGGLFHRVAAAPRIPGLSSRSTRQAPTSVSRGYFLISMRHPWSSTRCSGRHSFYAMQDVNIPFNEIDIKEMTAHIEVHASPLKPGVVG